MSFLSSFLKGVGKAVTGVVGNIPIVGDIANSMMSDYENREASKQQIGMSKDLMQYQNDLNMSNWETQNAYNTPQNQLQRIMDAGLNPLAFGLDGNSAGSPATVSGASAPDISSLLNYQMSLSLAKSQLKTQALDQQAKRYENKALEAESEARVAEARDREQEALANLKLKNRPGSPPEGEGWTFDDSDNTWRRTDPESLTVETVKAGTVRDDLIRSRIAREMNESELVEFERRFKKFETELYQKYGESIEKAKLSQAVAIIRNALLQGDMTELDLNTFKKLGIGPNVIRTILSGAQSLTNWTDTLIGAGALLAK